MRFSLIIVTRKRTNYLKNLIESINNTTKNKSEIELHIGIDNDDPETSSVKEEIINKYKDIKIEFHQRERSSCLVQDYLNWMILNFSSGKYIMNLNDDIIFLKQDWDELAWNKLETYISDKKDGIVYGFTEEKETSKAHYDPNTVGGFSCFPLISRQAVNALGWFFDNEFKAWSADTAIALVYNKINRICDLRNEVIMEHLSVHAKKREADSVFIEMANNCQGGFAHTTFVERDVQILSNYINNYKNETI